MRQGRTSAVGAGLVLALLAGMAALTWVLASWTWDAWQVIAGEPVVGVDAVLGVVAAGTGTLLGGWLLVSTSWCALSVLRGLQAPALTPLLLRRLVVLLLGVGLAASANPGYAATAPQESPAATATLPGWQPTDPAPVFRLSPRAPDASGGGTGTPWVPSPPPGAGTPESGAPGAGTPEPGTPEPKAPQSTPEAETPRTPKATPEKSREADGSRGSAPDRDAQAEASRRPAGPAAPAPADPAADPASPAADTEPGLAEGEAAGPAQATPGDQPGQGTEVVVAEGDTLWDIAARDLGPGASDAQIARAWPAWHATNLKTVGPDPDRIFPGQRLRPPA